jgi:hypothetical protein
MGVLQIARQMPTKIPTERQSVLLVGVLDKAMSEGLLLD